MRAAAGKGQRAKGARMGGGYPNGTTVWKHFDGRGALVKFGGGIRYIRVRSIGFVENGGYEGRGSGNGVQCAVVRVDQCVLPNE